ncbi:MAG: alcohol dehydrogenase catalytic domain-containing protein [Candidatus Caldarchaeum sp.]
MKALYFDGARLSLVKDHRPRAEDEALVQVVLAGICGTDLEILKGYAGFRGVPGHEFVGVVEKSRDPELVGKRVVGEINVGCGKCGFCSKGLERHCPRRTVLGIKERDGAFAEYLTLPERNLHVVPDEVPDVAAVFTEPVAAAYEVLEQTHVDPSWRVAVVGDGRLGSLIAQVISTLTPELIIVGKHQRKMNRLKGLGFRCVHVDEVEELHGFDLVVEASGSTSGLLTAAKLVKPRGVIILKSTVADAASINLSPLVVNEVNLIGSRCGPFKPALQALSKKLVKPENMVDAVYSLDEYEAAFSHAASRDALKVLLKP